MVIKSLTIMTESECCLYFRMKINVIFSDNDLNLLEVKLHSPQLHSESSIVIYTEGYFVADSNVNVRIW